MKQKIIQGSSDYYHILQKKHWWNRWKYLRSDAGNILSFFTHDGAVRHQVKSIERSYVETERTHKTTNFIAAGTLNTKKYGQKI